MRARNIKPGYYVNEDLAECSIWARYIFPGLWMLADREGRLEDRPKRIKGEILRYDDQPIEPLLAELEASGFITRYEVGGGKYIQINKFATHQSPHYSEKPSEIPAPGGASLPESGGDNGDLFPESHGDHGGRSPEISAIATRRSTTSNSLNPDSLIPDSRSPRVAGFPPGFAEFWGAYPTKIAKQQACKAFARLKPTPALLATMLAALERQKDSDLWKRGIGIPYPSTWINGRRWEDATASEDRGFLEGNV